jgi:hypothetical protein
MMSEKVYRFSLLFNSESKTKSTSILNSPAPEFMSSVSLLNSLMKRNRDQIIRDLSFGGSDDKAKYSFKNGESTTFL